MALALRYAESPVYEGDANHDDLYSLFIGNNVINYSFKPIISGKFSNEAP